MSAMRAELPPASAVNLSSAPTPWTRSSAPPMIIRWPSCAAQAGRGGGGGRSPSRRWLVTPRSYPPPPSRTGPASRVTPRQPQCCPGGRQSSHSMRRAGNSRRSRARSSAILIASCGTARPGVVRGSTRPHGVSDALPLPPPAGGDRQRLVHVLGSSLIGHCLPPAQRGADGVGSQFIGALGVQLHVVAVAVAGVEHSVSEPAQVISADSGQLRHAGRVIHGGSSPVPAAAPAAPHPALPPARRCRAR